MEKLNSGHFNDQLILAEKWAVEFGRWICLRSRPVRSYASRHGTLTSTEGLFVAKCIMPDEPIAPSPEGAAAALRQIARAWELDRSDTMALVLARQADFSTIEWTQERLTRVAFLMELENALFKLQPRGGVPRWLSTAKPGPFFGDQSPLQILTGPTSDIAALLREVRAWTGRR